MSNNQRGSQVALDARAERDARIPEAFRLTPEFIAKYPPGADVRAAAAESGLMSPEELNITSLDQDAVSILARIKSKEITALLCCLTDFFLDDALARAKELDDFYAKTGKLVGPLHGLPISIKDHIYLAGRKSTTGFCVDTLQPPATKNGFLPQILYDAGAEPTTSRVPKGGLCPEPGADSIDFTFGPISRSLRDIDLWFSIVLGCKPWLKENSLVPIPWEVPTTPSLSGSNGRLRIGVMWHDDVVLPQPPIRRALKTLVDALIKDPGLELVEYKPFKHSEAVALAHELYFVDGGECAREKAAAGGESLLPLTEWVITLPSVKNHTVHELWEMNIRRDTLRAQYLEHYNAQNVDVVLCPAGPGPAPPLGTSKYWGYTNVWNFVDYPAAVFPTGLHSDPALDVKDTAPRTYMGETDRLNSDSYDPEVFAGAPLCLQLVSRRFADELVVRALEEISKALPLGR
ncbi:Amidase domain-containing protein [Mycena sanguinolenta]|uniref:Amidase domain-containing protein n=1 Tax=Mycena sanguinolenta TaxID=230812 RepID=A0A8H7CLT2_9AGAR|nr:Amidase domain-containing protein [Mycena sanguinolenta]